MGHPASLLVATESATKIIASVWPPEKWRDISVLIGVSGGGDSVALAILLHRLRGTASGKITLAHFDHRLRAEAVAAEKSTVADLAKSLRIEFISGQAPDIPSLSVSENLLRDQRFNFFADAMRNTGARYLALAHTREDQVETVLQRILRGSGLRGLSGIHPFRSFGEDWVIARPLLGASKVLLRDVLAEHQAAYHEDATNFDMRWVRNWMRHELLPSLQSRYEQAPAAIVRLSQQADEASAALQIWASRLSDRSVRFTTTKIEIDLEPLADTPEIVIREMLYLIWQHQDWPLRAMSFDHWQAVSQGLTLAGETLAFDLPGLIHFTCSGKVATLCRDEC